MHSSEPHDKLKSIVLILMKNRLLWLILPVNTVTTQAGIKPGTINSANVPKYQDSQRDVCLSNYTEGL